jgi:hypothetical protein
MEPVIEKGALAALADDCGRWLGDAKNFVSLTAIHPVHGKLEISIRKVDGQSPAERIKELERILVAEDEDWLDEDDYPTDAACNHIKGWPLDDVKGLLEFICSLWRYPDYAKVAEVEDYTEFRLSTGGWSGNESLLGALREHPIAWPFAWFSSQRGGHHVFKVPNNKVKP